MKNVCDIWEKCCYYFLLAEGGYREKCYQFLFFVMSSYTTEFTFQIWWETSFSFPSFIFLDLLIWLLLSFLLALAIDQNRQRWNEKATNCFSFLSAVWCHNMCSVTANSKKKKLIEFKNVEYFLQAFRTYMPLLFRLKKAESRFKKWLIWGSSSDWDRILKLQMLHIITLILQILGSLSIKKIK